MAVVHKYWKILEALREQRLACDTSFPTSIWQLIVEYEIDSQNFVTNLFSLEKFSVTNVTVDFRTEMLFGNLTGFCKITLAKTKKHKHNISTMHDDFAMQELLVLQPYSKIIPKELLGQVRAFVYSKIPVDGKISIAKKFQQRVSYYGERTNVRFVDARDAEFIEQE